METQHHPKIKSQTQESVLRILHRTPGFHYLGSGLARMCGCNPRTLRSAIRSLRFDFEFWNILSHAGDDPATDGYWISTDKKEIEANRKYHEQYGRDHLARSGRMTSGKCEPIATAAGQQLMFT